MHAPINQEALQEKWAPLLDADGQDPIKDAHRRMVTAVLLENQEQTLKEEREFLSESPTNAAGTGGYGDLLDRECHLVEGIARGAEIFSLSGGHTLTDAVGRTVYARVGVKCSRVRTGLTSCTHTNVGSTEVESFVLTGECGICFVEQSFGSTLSLVA